MAVPRNRSSNAAKNSRRAHSAHKPKGFASCEGCGNRKLPHHICQSCGHYNGRSMISIKDKSDTE